jgi:hypothetical protein
VPLPYNLQSDRIHACGIRAERSADRIADLHPRQRSKTDALLASIGVADAVTQCQVNRREMQRKGLAQVPSDRC